MLLGHRSAPSDGPAMIVEPLSHVHPAMIVEPLSGDATNAAPSSDKTTSTTAMIFKSTRPFELLGYSLGRHRAARPCQRGHTSHRPVDRPGVTVGRRRARARWPRTAPRNSRCPVRGGFVPTAQAWPSQFLPPHRAPPVMSPRRVPTLLTFGFTRFRAWATTLY